MKVMYDLTASPQKKDSISSAIGELLVRTSLCGPDRSRVPIGRSHTDIDKSHLASGIEFLHGGNFQMIKAKKRVLMSTHHISITIL